MEKRRVPPRGEPKIHKREKLKKNATEGDVENKISVQLSTRCKLRNGKKIAVGAFYPIKNTPAWIEQNSPTKRKFLRPEILNK